MQALRDNDDPAAHAAGPRRDWKCPCAPGLPGPHRPVQQTPSLQHGPGKGTFLLFLLPGLESSNKVTSPSFFQGARGKWFRTFLQRVPNTRKSDGNTCNHGSRDMAHRAHRVDMAHRAPRVQGGRKEEILHITTAPVLLQFLLPHMT